MSSKVAANNILALLITGVTVDIETAEKMVNGGEKLNVE